MNKEKKTRFLLLYGRILIVVFTISMLLSGLILFFSDTPDCYRELNPDEIIFQDSDFFIYNNVDVADSNCTIVSDVQELERQLNNYKIKFYNYKPCL